MESRFLAGVRFLAPPLETRFRAPAGPPCARGRRSSPRIPEANRPLRHLRRRRRSELHHPNADQVARDAMTSGESVKRLAGDELLRHLAVEFDAMGTVSGHGFHPPKAQPPRSIPRPHLSGLRGALHQAVKVARRNTAKLRFRLNCVRTRRLV